MRVPACARAPRSAFQPGMPGALLLLLLPPRTVAPAAAFPLLLQVAHDQVVGSIKRGEEVLDTVHGSWLNHLEWEEGVLGGKLHHIWCAGSCSPGRLPLLRAGAGAAAPSICCRAACMAWPQRLRFSLPPALSTWLWGGARQRHKGALPPLRPARASYLPATPVFALSACRDFERSVVRRPKPLAEGLPSDCRCGLGAAWGRC